MKVALYARVSKADDTQDPENQLSRLRTYAMERQYEVVSEFVDKASGADAHRPQLDAMIRAAKAHRFSMILTVKVDRIARSVPNLYAMLTDLESRGVKFECSDQDISTNSTTGKLLLAILAGVAEFERELIVDRTKAGLGRARAAGVHLGRKPDLARTAKIVDLKVQGLSVPQISERMGIKPAAVKQRLRRYRLQKRGVTGT